MRAAIRVGLIVRDDEEGEVRFSGATRTRRFHSRPHIHMSAG